MKEEENRLIPMHIFDIYPYPDAQQGLGAPQNFLVLLKGDENRVVPITIGHFEGQALAMAIRKIALPRPLLRWRTSGLTSDPMMPDFAQNSA